VITPTLALLESAFDQIDLSVQPTDGAHALPASMYRNGPIIDIERSAVFARHWQYLGHRSQLSTDGEILMASLGGLDVALAHSAQGIRGFHAVCRHRAGPLKPCRGRGKTFLRCRYHAWAYGLDGQLLSAPEMRGAEGFDVSAIRLPEIEVVEFEGLLFGRLEPGPESLEEALVDVASRLAHTGHALPTLRFHERVSYEIDCNWKTYVDNYLEGYHVPHIHPTLNAILDYRSYTTTLSRWYSLQSSPLESKPDAYGSGGALYYFVYPNTMLNILPGRLQTNRVFPLKGNRCRVEFDFLYREAPVANDREFSDVVQQEDIRICEDVQHNLDSGSYVSGLLNPTRESGVHHFQELLRSDYREALRRAKETQRQA